MTNHRYCVILAGGIGTRFWPLSREYKPKQFLRVWNQEKSFIRYTFERMARTIPVENIYVATLFQYKGMVQEHLPELPEANIILEPYGRNTAPTVAYTATLLQAKDPEAVIVVAPADHNIADNAMFDKNIIQALDLATEQDILLTLGIVPTRPDTNFGYVQVTGGRDAYSSGALVKAKTFTEKPDTELAKVFLDSGEFLWNSGIFFWKASVVLEEMRKCCPELANLWEGYESAPDKEAFVQRAYSDSTRISIDYALMEKSEKVWVLPAKFIWSDIGSWSTLYEDAADRQDNGNAISLEGKHIIKNVSHSIITGSDSGKLTVVCNLDNFMVIDTDKILLVCPRDDRRLQEILSELALPEYSEFK
ncbi:MAG: mannose-1-phosphate guanylyltransferase [Bacteroidales bacterium]|nr:mannose-1-phosphate guanylyltransferase [Bacteroidales bacterium]